MIFLDKFAAAVLYGLPDFFQVPALYLYRHKAIEQGKSVIKVRAEDRRQKKP